MEAAIYQVLRIYLLSAHKRRVLIYTKEYTDSSPTYIIHFYSNKDVGSVV